MNGDAPGKSILLGIILFCLAASCGMGPSEEKRAQLAGQADGDIEIGIVRTSAYSNFFLEGVTLAVEEINAGGGLLGRKLHIIVHDDRNEAGRGEKAATALARKKEVVAVIGHGNSNTAIPASVIYEKSGILFISCWAKNPVMTLYGGNYTFRNIPSQKKFGVQMAEFVQSRGMKKTVVFHERDAAQKSLANSFKKRATALGIEIKATRSYFGWEREFREVIAALLKVLERSKKKAEAWGKPEPGSKLNFDSIFISGTRPGAAELVKQLREMGIGVPIVGGKGLDSPGFWAAAGKAAEGIVVPTVFNPGYPDKKTRDFVRRFKERYELIPDTWAAQGYDAVSVLAHIIQESGSTVPLVMSTNLRYLEDWNGVTGSYSFTPRGDISGKEIFFKKRENGAFFFQTLLNRE
ncbi:MAG: ABC transporter substrate-binding protein [Desulfobacterales bacterium]|nr:ABC transporter substrate-binding protein [Desulfobacterales bacterium]